MTWRQLNLLDKKSSSSNGKGIVCYTNRNSVIIRITSLGEFFVVEFLCDYTLSVVDRKKVLSEKDPEIGNTYDIQWSKKKTYEAIIRCKESSKKEAEQVMAQFTIDGPSHPKWACVKNKNMKSLDQKKPSDDSNKENILPSEEILDELAKGLKPGEGKFVIELGSPATPKAHSIEKDSDKNGPNEDESMDTSLETSSIEISDNVEHGAQMTIDIDSFDKTPERNPGNIQKFHPSKESCCECHLLVPMIKEVMSTVKILAEEVKTIKEILTPQPPFKNPYTQPSYPAPDPPQPYPQFTAPDSPQPYPQFTAPDSPQPYPQYTAPQPPSFTLPSCYQPAKKMNTLTCIHPEVQITEVEQAGPRLKKPRYEDELDFNSEETGTSSVQSFNRTPLQSRQLNSVQTPFGRPAEDPMWYRQSKTTPSFCVSPSNNLLRVMKPETVFTLDYLLSTKRKSCSIGNFAVNLTRVLFSEEERMNSNVRGKRDKMQLDPNIMNRVREAALKMYPVSAPDKETRNKMESRVWGECIKAIDESGRRLLRPKRKESLFEETIY